jgi:hypothetical protein
MLKKIMQIFLLTLLMLVIVNTALSQEPVVQSFPSAILLIPLALGMFAHWLKGFTRGTIPASWGGWLIDNIGFTIAALVAGVGQLVGFYQLSPEILNSGGVGAWWIVFMMGYASDSVMNTNGKFVKS